MAAIKVAAINGIFVILFVSADAAARVCAPIDLPSPGHLVAMIPEFDKF